QAFETEIIPANRVVAQLGETLVLTCNSTGCASPSFSWRTQMDNPLGGTVNNHRTFSTLTMNPVRIANSHLYVCTVFCGEEEKKEKSIKVELYSFPSDPVVEIHPSFDARPTVNVTCKIPDVYPSDRLEVILKKEEHVLHTESFHDDDCTDKKTKTVVHSFNYMPEDIGKEITCVAMLPIADMDFEPKERVTSQKLNANYAPEIVAFSIEPSTTVGEGENVSIQCSAESNPPPKVILRRKFDSAGTGPYSEGTILVLPSVTLSDGGDYECVAENQFGTRFFLSVGPRNTGISVVPAAAVKEGETVTMTCTSSGNPAPVISWKKKAATGELEKTFEDAVLTIQNVRHQDSGLYECDAYNHFGKERKSVKLLVQVPPQNVTVLVYPSENVKEGENVTITCSTYSNPPSQMVLKKVHQEKEIILPSVNGTFILYNVTQNDTGRYLLDVFNEVGKDIKVIDIAVVGRLEKPDQMLPLIIAFSSVTAVAVPLAAVLIYVSRKAKINGSYSLVKALGLKV
ncbi:PREDICTED: vascular cell adhesion protein 1-like, partial [Eurypyga helias]|uniref:vascular cell adhesion protein 1-like n=1 Tax=Eurypyga helias TaxID=54383 RepID=UPI0005288293